MREVRRGGRMLLARGGMQRDEACPAGELPVDPQRHPDRAQPLPRLRLWPDQILRRSGRGGGNRMRPARCGSSPENPHSRQRHSGGELRGGGALRRGCADPGQRL